MNMPSTAPGQQYGQAKQQQAVLSAVPDLAPTVGAGPVASPPPVVPPGSLGALDRPTERPAEPVTAGAPIGPGPNSIPGVDTSINPDLKRMIRQLPFLQILATNPDASESTRQLYRQVLTASMRETN